MPVTDHHFKPIPNIVRCTSKAFAILQYNQTEGHSKFGLRQTSHKQVINILFFSPHYSPSSTSNPNRLLLSPTSILITFIMQFVQKAEDALTEKKDESHEPTQSSNRGPHSSNIANKADTRVEFGLVHRARHGTVPGGVGLGSTYHTTTTNTSPHNSNIANKLDPRVDSNFDPRATHQSLSGTGAGTKFSNSGRGG